MATWLQFTSGLGLTALVSFTVVLYLRHPLERLLVELCGNENRARFWTVFSEVTVGAVPLIFALACRPGNNANGLALLEVADQLEWGLIGMVISVLLLGWILGRFILRAAPKS